MDPRLRRLAENEALLREINERSRESAADVWAHQQTYRFLCECADADCDARLALAESEYERVRSQARWFLVAPGHASLEIERVVESSQLFEIVEMKGDAARLAEKWDSRARRPLKVSVLFDQCPRQRPGQPGSRRAELGRRTRRN